MDAVDRKIVSLLRENARRSFKDIGGHVHLSAPAVKRRVDRLEREGVIRGYAAVVDTGPSAGTPRPSWTSSATGGCRARRSGGPSRRSPAWCPPTRSPARRARCCTSWPRTPRDLELVLERIRSVDGIDRTVTEVVLSTLFRR